MKRLAVAVLCGVMTVACTSVMPLAAPSERAQSLQQELSALAKTGETADLPGYALRVYSHGKLLFAHDTGYAGAGFSKLIREDTTFELASLSKIFTALAVMQLQERGLIDLQASLAAYIPGLPRAWSGVTVHHVLSHQSGLPDLMNQWSRRRVNGLDLKALMAHFEHNARLQFEPGTRAAYSNTNYILLAELVAQVSGQDFGDYLRLHIFEPSGMVSSAVSAERSHGFNVIQALPYAENNKIHEVGYSLIGAINQKSSMHDMVQFVHPLLQNKLIRPETLDRMMTPHAVFEDGKRYGYGWYMGQLGGWAALSSTLPAAGVGHTGRLGAYRSALYFNKQRNFQLLMLSNGGVKTEKLLVDFLQKTRTRLE